MKRIFSTSLVVRTTVIAVTCGALLSACGGSSGSSQAEPTSSTVPKPGTAKIVSFDVPESVQCDGGPSTMVAVSYATADAKSQQILVDGRATPGTDASKGTVQAQVHCDAIPHTVVLYVLDGQNRPTSQRKMLTTELPSG